MFYQIIAFKQSLGDYLHSKSVMDFGFAVARA